APTGACRPAGSLLSCTGSPRDRSARPSPSSLRTCQPQRPDSMQNRASLIDHDFTVCLRWFQVFRPEAVGETQQPLVARAAPSEGEVLLRLEKRTVDQEIGVGEEAGTGGVAAQAFVGPAGEDHGREAQRLDAAEEGRHGLRLLGGLAAADGQAIDLAPTRGEVGEKALNGEDDARLARQVRLVGAAGTADRAALDPEDVAQAWPRHAG